MPTREVKIKTEGLTPSLNHKGKIPSTFIGERTSDMPRSIETKHGEAKIYTFIYKDGDMPFTVKDGDTFTDVEVKAGTKIDVMGFGNALKQVLPEVGPGDELTLTRLPDKRGSKAYQFKATIKTAE